MHKKNKPRLDSVIISPRSSISQSVSALDRSGTGILLVCDKGRKLIGVLTDGDIRRAVINNVSFEDPCISIASRDPVIARVGISKWEALKLMDQSKEFVVDHLPLVDGEGTVVDLLLRRDIVGLNDIEVDAVIMAGGFGKRLGNLTDDIPKPMLTVGDRPLIEQIVEHLKESGIQRVNITTHYLANKIKEYFDDGQDFGVEINYIEENLPLGTAGALGLMSVPTRPQLIINGDILTRVDFRAMFSFHRNQNAEITIGVRKYDLEIPYGVVDCDGMQVCGLREKPRYKFLVNAGVYLLEPSVYSYIPIGQHYNMTDLIEEILKKGGNVISFPIVEYWLDIGEPADYLQAQKDTKNGIV